MKLNNRHKIKRIIGGTFHNLTNRSARKRVIAKFADKIGIVYFGSVNQHDDEHKIIRGFTASSTHIDNNYCVGTVNGFDICLVDRCDSIIQNHSVLNYNWVVLAINLKTKQDVPHFFIKANDNNPKPYNLLFGTFPLLTEVNLGTFENYSENFQNHYSINSKTPDSIQVEKLITARTADTITNHLWPLSIEQHEGVLYIYTDKLKITSNLMDVMLEGGLWLANYIDNQAELM